ncbi:phosphatase domain-containing protein [Jiangella alkaliphila]|uniref:Polynucleotide kinase PNKP phosphatase domain-containing protein n=1 Tax=Jiangella alkaliphila TaxID=419479 RepID=A0A1H2KVJ9_9ACTN|nr:nucleotidase [Jiangella alkaliphila]SDU72595.1 hypothetical protein SAMN04488563_4369 [Jiangella alkaliphila]
MNRPVAVVDIDGVLADVQHRLHHLNRRPKNWAGFFGAMSDDTPYAEGIELVTLLANEHEVVYLSGRPERTRAVTRSWLAENGAPAGTIMLRPDDDRRPARQFKVGVLRRLSAHRDVAMLVDDDPAVCTAARAAGFTVYEVEWSRPDPTLFSAQEADGRT